MVCVFVGSLYMLPWSLRKLPRNAPAHIKGRIGSLTAACVVCCGLTVWLLAGAATAGAAASAERAPSIAAWLGIRLDGLVAAMIVPTLVAATLFLGPLAERSILFWASPPGRKPGLALRELLLGSHADEDTLVMLRAVVFAPLFEELVFRSCMLPLLCQSGSTCTRVVLVSPLLFGIAHLHHAFNSLQEGNPVGQVVAVVALQTFYTSLFGIFANFVFLRTGHLAAVVVLHAFCNNMGFPAPECMQEYSRAYPYRYGMSLSMDLSVCGSVCLSVCLLWYCLRGSNMSAAWPISCVCVSCPTVRSHRRYVPRWSRALLLPIVARQPSRIYQFWRESALAALRQQHELNLAPRQNKQK